MTRLGIVIIVVVVAVFGVGLIMVVNSVGLCMKVRKKLVVCCWNGMDGFITSVMSCRWKCCANSCNGVNFINLISLEYLMCTIF